MNGILDLLSDYTVRTVVLGSAVLGAVSGSLGSFAVLRKQSLLGDAVSHAALPGIAIAFLLTGSKAPLVLLIGAAIAGWLGTLLIGSIIRNTRLKDDSAMGIVLSVFFGIGLVVLTFIQKLPNAAQAGLDKYLFGQAATLLPRDILTMTAAGGLAVLVMLLFWKEFKLVTFDSEYGASLGVPVNLVNILLTTCIVIAIVTGLQAVGVVLMSAMVVTPAVCARQWTERLGSMVIISAIIGSLSGAAGAFISSVARNIPTGPTIVIALALCLVLSIAFGSRRGMVWKALRGSHNRKRYALDRILRDLFALAAHHESWEHGHSSETLKLMGHTGQGVLQGLIALEGRGYVRKLESGEWALTPNGKIRAQSLDGA